MLEERPTQCERILAILSDGEWHSGEEFLAARISRFHARFVELKRSRKYRHLMAGKTIESRPGQALDDGFRPFNEYRLVAVDGEHDDT